MVFEARQRMEQLQGTDVEGHSQQDMEQDIQVPGLQEGLVHHEGYPLSRPDKERATEHLPSQKGNHRQGGKDDVGDQREGGLRRGSTYSPWRL